MNQQELQQLTGRLVAHTYDTSDGVALTSYRGMAEDIVSLAHYAVVLNPLGLIDDEFAERVNRVDKQRVKLTKPVNHPHSADFPWQLLISGHGERRTGLLATVTHKHQVAKILDAYEIKIPE